MKTNFLKIMAVALTFCAFLPFVQSCSNDPDTPHNEIEDKDHEEPVKAVLVLAEGHLHGPYSFHQNPETQGVKFLKKVQTITFESTRAGWHLAKGSADHFNVRSAMKNAKGKDVYGLWIYYYNAKGEVMNGELVSNGQELLHQHFFIPKDVMPTFDGVKEADDNNIDSIYTYVYCDTNPWDKTMHSGEATLIGNKNPIGLKGYFQFLKTRKQFYMNIELMHAANSKFNDGKASPFNAPTKVQRQRDDWDMKVRIPVVIYANQGEYVECDNNTPENEISAHDMRLLQSIAHAYHITWKEALQDLSTQFSGDPDPESGQLWF